MSIGTTELSLHVNARTLHGHCTSLHGPCTSLHGPCTSLHVTARYCTVLARHCTVLARYCTVLHGTCTLLHVTARHYMHGTAFCQCTTPSLPLLQSESLSHNRRICYLVLTYYIISSSVFPAIDEKINGFGWFFFSKSPLPVPQAQLECTF